jgi:hypothetical protein
VLVEAFEAVLAAEIGAVVAFVVEIVAEFVAVAALARLALVGCHRYYQILMGYPVDYSFYNPYAFNLLYHTKILQIVLEYFSFHGKFSFLCL